MPTSRQSLTGAYALQLAERSPRVPGEHRLTGAVPPNLRKPDETIGVPDLVVRARYWTAPGSPDHVYRLLKQSSPPGLRLTGYGLPSSPAEDLAGRGFVHFDPRSAPPYIQGEELYIEIEPAPNGGTVIAAFGEAYAAPLRSPTEHIDVSGSTVTANWPELRDGKVVAHHTSALKPATAKAVITGFNSSQVADNPYGCFGPFIPAGDLLTLTIRDGTLVWKLVYPGTGCLDVSVTLGGHQLAAIQPNTRFRGLLNRLRSGRIPSR